MKTPNAKTRTRVLKRHEAGSTHRSALLLCFDLLLRFLWGPVLRPGTHDEKELGHLEQEGATSCGGTDTGFIRDL